MSAVQAITTTAGHTGLAGAAVEQLKASLRGELLLPDDDRYEETRRVWNGMIDKRPALIARCAGVADVVATVTFAREHDLLVSVRGGGHSVAGKAVCNGGLMIDLSRMRGVEADPVTRTARVEGGALLGDLDRATQVFGLATTAGVVTHTGVAGLTLGGGVGRLAHKYGLACDNLLSVELVTAEGRVLRASPTENIDLFWGVRGGGGNFGIVTTFEFRLHPVGPQVLGGIVMYPIVKARAALKFYYEYSQAAPDELSADAFLLTLPNGDQAFAIDVCYIGPLAHGERVLQPLRQFGPPLADQIGPTPYTQLQASGDAFFPPGLHYYYKSHFMTEISEEAIEALVSHFATVPSPRSVVAFQQYGGAVSRIGQTDTAFGHREAQYNFIPASAWTDPTASERHLSWVREAWDIMRPFATGGVYVNNLAEEGEEQVRAAYGPHYERLVAVKTKYDPDNFFRLNANIKPTV
jgi:FAD binding domain/Berberine and berberine like